MTGPRVHRSKEFKSWYESLTLKDQGIVDTRIDSYREHDKLVQAKLLDANFCLYEFKWSSGLRVYFSMIQDEEGKLILLLLGGNKNSQQRDINRSKSILMKAIQGIQNKKKGPDGKS